MTSDRDAPRGWKSVEEIFDLSSRTAVVTGANGWLGRAITEGLLLAGARVILIDRICEVSEFARFLEERFGRGRAESFVTDMFDTAAYGATLVDIDARYGPVQIIVNNAYGYTAQTKHEGPDGALEKLTKDRWMRSIESGSYWAMQTVQALGNGMKVAGRGAVINICSMYSLIAPDPSLYEGEWSEYLTPASYVTAKTGLLGFTRYMASFWGVYGIRFNAIAPGAFSKPGTDPRFIRRLEARTVLGRIGRPEDVIGAVIFLASDASSYITGECLTVDGGWTIR